VTICNGCSPAKRDPAQVPTRSFIFIETHLPGTGTQEMPIVLMGLGPSPIRNASYKIPVYRYPQEEKNIDIACRLQSASIVTGLPGPPFFSGQLNFAMSSVSDPH
jgi:hypothetical protein